MSIKNKETLLVKMLFDYSNLLGLLVDIKTSLKILDLIDIMLNLNNGTFKPYKKPNDIFSYTYNRFKPPITNDKAAA